MSSPPLPIRTSQATAITGFLRAQSKAVRRPLALSVGASLGGGFLMIVQAWLLATIVTDVAFAGADLDAQWGRLTALMAVFIARAGLSWLADRLAFEAAAQVKLDLRARLHFHLGRVGPVRLAGIGAGDLVTMLSDGVEALEAYYARYLPSMATMTLIPGAVLVVVVPHDWLSAVVLVVTAPLIPVFMIFIGKGAERLNQKQWRKLARMSAHFLDMIQGLTTLKLFDASRREAAAIARMSDDYRRATMAVLRVAFLSALALEFFATVSIALVAVLIGFRLLAGNMVFYDGFLVLLLAPEFYLPLRRMGINYHARMAAIGAAERMTEVLDLPAMQHDNGGQSAANRAVPSGSFRLVFQDVTFAYDDARPALEGVSFTIDPGAHIALVGPSGAGKSTVFNLVLAFIAPQRGRILVNGEPLSDLDPDAWRHAIAYVPQNPTLFHGTIADNIRLGRPGASLAAVEAAARAAEAAEFIAELPHGYDTHVEERGVTLSGGQIQRLALARAFLQDARLVLLDEPTANLDLDSERLIEQAVAVLRQTRTVVSIAHRLRTVRSADCILVFENGHIVERGDHGELVALGGLYARQVRSGASSTPHNTGGGG